MANSNTEICNIALTTLGLDPIVSLESDPSQSGILCRVKWAPARDFVLREANWRCLLKRSGSLSRLSGTPPFGYAYQYATPTDCIRVVGMSVDAAWDVERNDADALVLLTDESEVYIRYVAYSRAADKVALFDSHMVVAIAARLAADLAPGLKSATRVKELEILARDALAQAKTMSAIEGRPEQASPTALLDVR